MVNVVINTFRGPVHVSDVVLHVVDFELRPPIILGVDLWRRFGVDVEAAIMGPLHDAVVQQGRVPAGAALAAVSVTRDESHAVPLSEEELTALVQHRYESWVSDIRQEQAEVGHI